MTTTVIKAHARAMEHGWNIIKFYGPGYDPTESSQWGPLGEMAQQGQKNLRSHRTMQERLPFEDDRTHRRWMQGRIREGQEEGHDTAETRRMEWRGDDSDYRDTGKEGEDLGPDARTLQGTAGGESSFDTQGTGSGLFEGEGARPEWDKGDGGESEFADKKGSGKRDENLKPSELSAEAFSQGRLERDFGRGRGKRWTHEDDPSKNPFIGQHSMAPEPAQPKKGIMSRIFG